MHIEEGVLLKNHTTFHIGGPAGYFVSVHTPNELREALQFAEEKEIPFSIIAGGSNILVSDDGVRGLVIKIVLGGIEYEETDTFDALVHVGAGVVLDELISDTVTRGYWGLENLSAIPGSVGATPVQNVGAYGVEVSSLIDSVSVYDTNTHEEKILTANECNFGYRSSLFKTDTGKKYVVTRVTFRLTKIPTPKIHYVDLVRKFGDYVPSLSEVRAAVIEIRSKKFPDWNMVGTAGSFFKNIYITKEKFLTLKEKYPEMPGYDTESGTVKVPLGWVLDKLLRIRGVCEGDVCSYEGQALVLINKKNATAREVKNFAEKISQRVRELCDIEIEWEVRELV